MHVGCHFDSGNISIVRADEPGDLQLTIRPDVGGDHFQWFHFRVTGVKGQPLHASILNASEASYPKGWQDYRACASYDGEEWFRVDTEYDGQVLRFRHRPEFDAISFAYFPPYTLERHRDLVATAALQTGVFYERLGDTVDGRDLDLLQVGSGADASRMRCWIIARQHPGESMAEWLVEGLLQHLLDPDEAVARALLARCCFYIVPNMNPDGSHRGHLRNNAAGQNLNRAWDAPSVERSPEVYWVRRKMEDTGVDFFLDVHGDEALPYNFVAGADGIPSFTEAMAARQRAYTGLLETINPDFQTTYGYPVAQPGQANMSMATPWVAERFSCLSMTLEQPFKDTENTPHPLGWTPERAKKLGRDQLVALRSVLDRLG